MKVRKRIEMVEFGRWTIKLKLWPRLRLA